MIPVINMSIILDESKYYKEYKNLEKIFKELDI